MSRCATASWTRAFHGASLDRRKRSARLRWHQDLSRVLATFARDDRRDIIQSDHPSEAVRYQFVATATPSPTSSSSFSRTRHSSAMDVSTAKTRFFQRDSEKADNLTIHPQSRSSRLCGSRRGPCSSRSRRTSRPRSVMTATRRRSSTSRWHEIAPTTRSAGMDKPKKDDTAAQRPHVRGRRGGHRRRVEGVARLALWSAWFVSSARRTRQASG